jgi:hypothetical protein
MARFDSACLGEYARDRSNCIAETKSLAFLMEEIVGELKREKYFCEPFNKA